MRAALLLVWLTLCAGGQDFGRTTAFRAAAVPKAGGGYVASATDFDGTDYMSRGANLTGAANGTKGSLSFWLKINAGNGTTRGLFVNDDNRFAVFLTSSDTIRVRCQNTAGTEICTFTTVNTYSSGGGWLHICASFDTTTGSEKTNLFVNGTSDKTTSTFTADAQTDYARAPGNFYVGALDAGGNPMTACISELWLSETEAIDFTQQSEREKFRSAGGAPVSLGADGSTPTGTQPILYLPNPFGTFQNNAGSGGNFTVTGTLTACSDHP